jgi:prepilin-type N-terminal cleavage/methylation domain-containing protein
MINPNSKQTQTTLPREAGFTLLELMISMALTALLLGMLSAGVYSVINDWERETSVLDETLDRSLVLLQIERALYAAFPHSYVDMEDFARYVYFQGNPESMSWVSTVSPYRVEGLTAWRLESDREDGVSLRLTPAFSDNPDERFENATATPLLPGYTAEFRYLLQRNEDEKLWVDEWLGNEMQSLPRAVHIVLTPIDEFEEEEVLEILAPIRTHEHEDIQPTTPLI